MQLSPAAPPPGFGLVPAIRYGVPTGVDGPVAFPFFTSKFTFSFFPGWRVADSLVVATFS